MDIRRSLGVIALVACFMLAGAVEVVAQIRGSERSTLTQDISRTEIVIDYSRPSLRGRSPIWGDLVWWGHIWTPGADDATTFSFSKDVELNGVEVPAGKYSIWMQPRESEPWQLMLHPDTTLFHIPEPSLDDALVIFDVVPTEVADFAETLMFNLENIRAEGAELQLRWGTTLVPIKLTVDPGYDLTLEEENASRYVGIWMYDQSMARPADSTIAKWRDGVPTNQLDGFDAYYELMKTPREIRFEYDPAIKQLYVYDPLDAETMGEDPTKPLFLFVRKSEGIFATGYLVNGELAALYDNFMWEFEFGEDGNANVFVEREMKDDKISGRGRRIEGSN